MCFTGCISGHCSLQGVYSDYGVFCSFYTSDHHVFFKLYQWSLCFAGCLYQWSPCFFFLQGICISDHFVFCRVSVWVTTVFGRVSVSVITLCFYRVSIWVTAVLQGVCISDHLVFYGDVYISDRCVLQGVYISDHHQWHRLQADSAGEAGWPHRRPGENVRPAVGAGSWLMILCLNRLSFFMCVHVAWWLPKLSCMWGLCCYVIWVHVLSVN